MQKKFALISILVIGIISFSCDKKKNNYADSNMETELVADSTNLNKLSNTISPEATIIKTSKTQKEYSLGELKITLIQYKSDGSDFFCKSEIIVTKNGYQLDSARFISDPVGGGYGISKATKLNNHIILTKHGNYDGRTLIINKKGNIFNIIGGNNYLDTESKLLFSIYESDVNGVAIFDLKIDSLIFKTNNLDDRPISIHKIDDRFFINCRIDSGQTDKNSIWKIEFEPNNLVQIDFNQNDINLINQLKNISVDTSNCKCEK